MKRDSPYIALPLTISYNGQTYIVGLLDHSKHSDIGHGKFKETVPDYREFPKQRSKQKHVKTLERFLPCPRAFPWREPVQQGKFKEGKPKRTPLLLQHWL